MKQSAGRSVEPFRRSLSQAHELRGLSSSGVAPYASIMGGSVEKDRELSEVALLVDYDNILPPNQGSTSNLVPDLNRWVSLARTLVPNMSTLRIRLYGGWLEDGALTNAASAVLAAIPRDYFPVATRPPSAPRLIRGSIDLATRLVGVPGIEWGHSFRTRKGLPRLRLAERPRPDGCIEHDNCPIDSMHRFAKNRQRTCQHAGCTVRNETAFVVHEQKMVDALLSCDAIELASQGVHVVVMSNDLDVLPGVAMIASRSQASVTLVRGPGAGDGDYYSEVLGDLGVRFSELEAA